ncbi:MAG: hypothetical protein U0521_24370 [Anaerolineae bacterium]
MRFANTVGRALIAALPNPAIIRRMTRQQKQSPSRRSLVIAAAVIVLAGAALLALDLANYGLAWRTMWSLTGE